MILGQSAVTAAVMALDRQQDPQDLPYDLLRARLLSDGQVLEFQSPASTQAAWDKSKLQGIVVDDDQAKLHGDWRQSTASGNFFGSSYRHDGNKSEQKCSASFVAPIPKPGRYEVRLSYPTNSNRSSKVHVEIAHADGKATTLINQKVTPKLGGMFESLGTYRFEKGNYEVVIDNQGSDGYVVIDAVQWLPVP